MEAPCLMQGKRRCLSSMTRHYGLPPSMRSLWQCIVIAVSSRPTATRCSMKPMTAVRPLRKDRKESLSFGRTSTSTSTKTMRRIKSAVQNTILSQMQKKQNTRLILVRMCIRSLTSTKPPCPMFIRKNTPSRWSSLDQTDRQMKSSFEWMSTNSSRV